MRARVVLWPTPGLASMKHFAISSSDTYEYSRGLFFHLGYSFSFRHVFLQPEPGFYEANKNYFYPTAEGLKTKNKKKTENKKRRQHV